MWWVNVLMQRCILWRLSISVEYLMRVWRTKSRDWPMLARQIDKGADASTRWNRSLNCGPLIAWLGWEVYSKVWGRATHCCSFVSRDWLFLLSVCLSVCTTLHHTCVRRLLWQVMAAELSCYKVQSRVVPQIPYLGYMSPCFKMNI